MEFEWNQCAIDENDSVSQRDIEESFEDPFVVRLLPDSPRFSTQARYFNLGKSLSGTGIISVYHTNGKLIRVIHVRPFVDEEYFFYERILNQSLSH
ncbi:MAG TPA: hypothetical protein EYQ50_13695 [Verrucomicrobiales bacterium]|jgi:uncharacterized DUF497 family protein|nr:hypothetical protein [Verrucomicrobiales bacterium]HIL71758.1 hypothetical protein [Verrucomicrobiota bacterium]